MHHKAFGGRAPPETDGQLTAGFRDVALERKGGRRERKEGQREEPSQF